MAGPRPAWWPAVGVRVRIETNRPFEIFEKYQNLINFYYRTTFSQGIICKFQTLSFQQNQAGFHAFSYLKNKKKFTIKN
jgi:hypothetical protein